MSINFDTRRKPVKEPDRTPGPYPYYGASGVVDHVDDYLFDGEYLLVAEDGENLRTRKTPFAFRASGKFWVNNHAHIVQGNEIARTRFLEYALLATDISPYLTGAVMPKLTQGNLNKIRIPCPPLTTQDEIVDTLGALDNRIDLLRQTNATLEAIAQALFKSWFVDFDPVHAKADDRAPEAMDAATAALFPSEFEQSELGPIPKGWRAGALKDVCKAHDSKRVPLSRLEREKRRGNYPYYGAASVMDHIDDYIFDGVYVLLAEDGSVATKDGFALTQYVWGRFWVNNHAHILEGIGGFSTEQLLLLLQRVRIHEYITGAVQAKLSQRNMFTIPVVIPPPAISKAFDSLVSPLFAKIREGTEAISTLTSLRGTLLPRLISGKLRLPKAMEATNEASA